MPRFFIFFCCLCLLTSSGTTPVKAQNLNADSVLQKMGLYNRAIPSSILFIHFDKTIYTNNETVWFTGYLLSSKIDELNKHKVLSVALVRDLDSAIIKQEKYLLNNGLSFGSMVLPDSMLTGNYHFQASTNRVSHGVPEVAFMQPIIVKTNIEPAFNAELKLLTPGIPGVKPHQLVLSVTTRDHRFLPKPVKVSYKYGTVFKNAMTNPLGEVILNVDEQPDLADPNVYVKVKYGTDSSFVNMALPVARRKAFVKFYPEGGNLIDGISCNIAWEVKDGLGAMVTSTATLYKNDQPIDSISTNGYGIGTFTLKPEKGSIYKVKLMHDGFTDTTYSLPAIVENGIGIYMAKAAAKDTAIMILSSKVPQKVMLRLHNFKESFLYSEIALTSLHKVVRIPLEGIPSGLKTITITDSLGRPLAERMLYAHYNPQQKISITTDQATYNQRQKVTLSLQLNAPDTIGMVSIACVQDNRLSSKMVNDIETYVNLKHDLGTLPLAVDGKGYRNSSYVEDLLLVKGWRRYTWQDLMKTNADDTVRAYDNLALKIDVKADGKPLKKPVQLGLLKDAFFSPGTTDSTGIYHIEDKDLLMEAGKKIQLFVTGKYLGQHTIKINDPYAALNKNYVKSFALEQNSGPSPIPNNNVLALKGNEKVIRLKEVKITSGKDNGLHYGRNECGDYVCMYNILNCRNHTSGTMPVPGRTYINGNGGGTIVYKKCSDSESNRFIVLIPAIYTGKEFYVDSFPEPLEPAFASTIYWNYGTMLDAKAREFVFYTGDIIGKFKVVVQGITNNNVLYGEHFFEVKAK